MPEKVTISYQYENGYRNVYRNCQRRLGAVHILRQPPEGGEGVWQMLTIADKGGWGQKNVKKRGDYGY